MIIPYLKVNINKERSVDKVNSNGPMETNMKEISKITSSKEMGNTLGKMAVFMKVSGKTTKCMELEYSHGLTKENIL